MMILSTMYRRLIPSLNTNAIAFQRKSTTSDTTSSTKGVGEAHEPPIDLPQDGHEPTEPEFVYYVYYGKVILAGLELPPRDGKGDFAVVNDTARALSEKTMHLTYDEYFDVGCYAFFDRCTYSAISEGCGGRSSLSPELVAAITLITAGHRMDTATEEVAGTQLGFIRLSKGGQSTTDP
jgi:hypothetical protein